MDDKKIPYPELDGIREDEKTLKIVSPAYAGDESELTAVLQYTYQAILLGETGHKDLAETLQKISMDEMRHVEILGRLVTKLGARPVFSYFPPYPIRFFTARSVSYSSSPKKMLADSIVGEQYAIDSYSRMIAKLTDESVRAVIARIRMDEMKHLQMLEEAVKSL